MKKNFKLLMLIVVIIAVIGGSVVAYDLLKEKAQMNLDNEILKEEGQNDNGQDSVDNNDGKKTDGDEDSDNQYIDFSMEDYEGNTIKLSDKVGKPIIINFWASWCPPCKQEMPYFNEMYQRYGEDIEFIMVDLVGSRNETVEDGKSFIEEAGYEFPVYFDVDQEGSNAYYITSMPTTIIIDEDGRIIEEANGMISKYRLKSYIDMIY
ncbi:MAG TPA: TlpA family protein disulfide reductase [Candidatus Merdenecus merdavium]|nr:TlpA family protein disulfide reductase [Candidatus Merdenecus merdavium]